MALERAPKRARVNATAPGHFATEMTEMTEMTEDYLSRLPARARHAARHPDERFGEESELDGGLLLRAPKNCVHAVARRERGERREERGRSGLPLNPRGQGCVWVLTTVKYHNIL